MDQCGNFNLSAVGDYDRPKVRFAGGAGSNMISMMAKRTIFFTTTHTQRIFVPQVDFVNGRARDDSISWRRGSMSHMVTPICLMKYDSDKRRITLDSTYPGVDVDRVVTNTGFNLGIDGRKIREIDPLTDEELDHLRVIVLEKLWKVYPLFCSTVWG
jgi:acyl CoA:acetate/3-ketoacid CoA transferase beta subunit